MIYRVRPKGFIEGNSLGASHHEPPTSALPEGSGRKGGGLWAHPIRNSIWFKELLCGADPLKEIFGRLWISQLNYVP